MHFMHLIKCKMFFWICWRPDNSCLNPQEVAIIITSIILLVMSLGGLYYAYKGSRLNSSDYFVLKSFQKKFEVMKYQGHLWCF